MMVFSKFLALALAASTATNAFVVVSPNTAKSSRSSLNLNLGATRKSDADDERMTSDSSIRNLAAVSAITLGLLFPSSDALAAEATVPRCALNDHAVLSSSVDLSKVITTMDFSLPSSYDNISDPVASGKDELTTTVNVETGSSKRSAASAESKKKSASSKSSGGGLSLNKMIALPSSSSSVSSMKEDAAAALAERVAQRKRTEAEQAARDEQAARERDANIRAAREEKIARRAAEQAEKEAAALAKQEEAKYDGVKFVDTSMPEY
jgi:hypothetical protein